MNSSIASVCRVHELDRRVGERDQLGLTRRQRHAVLPARREVDAGAGEKDDKAGRRSPLRPVRVGALAERIPVRRVTRSVYPCGEWAEYVMPRFFVRIRYPSTRTRQMYTCRAAPSGT
eukprot:2572430-Prymnesium_polylepis.1